VLLKGDDDGSHFEIRKINRKGQDGVATLADLEGLVDSGL